jgi:hypothetical protein
MQQNLKLTISPKPESKAVPNLLTLLPQKQVLFLLNCSLMYEWRNHGSFMEKRLLLVLMQRGRKHDKKLFP